MLDGLSGQRYNSACALVKDLHGDLLVAVAGGSYPGSKGLEVYNPKDGSVTLLSEYLPQEEASDKQVLLKSFFFTLFLTPGARLPVLGPFHSCFVALGRVLDQDPCGQRGEAVELLKSLCDIKIRRLLV